MLTRTSFVLVACSLGLAWIAPDASANPRTKAGECAPPEKVDVCHNPPGQANRAIRLSLGARAAVQHISQHNDVVVPEDDSCTAGVGECAVSGMLACTSDGLLCDAEPLAPSEPTEVSCTDGLDNDCDGLADGFDDDCGCTPDPATEVAFNGTCYYLDGSNGVCDPGYALAPQSVLTSIATGFAGKTYRYRQSDNCCIKHANQAAELQDWGMANADCNAPGPFTSGPVLGGRGCTNQNLNLPKQLTLCGSQ
jgi:hypothetical protein